MKFFIDKLIETLKLVGWWKWCLLPTYRVLTDRIIEYRLDKLMTQLPARYQSIKTFARRRLKDYIGGGELRAGDVDDKLEGSREPFGESDADSASGSGSSTDFDEKTTKTNNKTTKTTKQRTRTTKQRKQLPAASKRRLRQNHRESRKLTSDRGIYPDYDYN